MEWVNCNVCGYNNLRRFLSIVKNTNFETSQWDILGNLRQIDLVICPKCNLIFTNPRICQSHLISLYTGDYHQQHKEEKRLSLFLKRLKSLLSYKKSGKLLDVGCGYGVFLKLASEHFDVSGVEISPDAVKFLTRNYPFKIYEENIESLPEKKDTFDVITLWDVVEHLYDPHNTLMCLHDMLKKDGILAISTGNVDSLVAKLFGGLWAYYHCLDHVYFFSLESLAKLLQSSHFKITDYYIENGGINDFVDFLFKIPKVPIKYLLHLTNVGLRNKEMQAKLKKLSRPLVPHFGDLMVVIAKKI